MLFGFIIGLSSSFHCLGMCGPIALAIPVNRSSNFSIVSGTLQYNFGRIIAYSLLGFLIGSIGFSFSVLKWMQWLSILAGLLMILIAWHKFFSSGQSKLEMKLTQQISRGIGQLIRSKNPFKLVGLGALNGFLPCGMVFLGLTNALIQGSPEKGTLAMVFFGLGTLPIMFTVVFFASKLSGNWRLKFSKAVPYIMTVIGILVILRGLNLGIPYISPEIKLSTESDEKQKVEMVCCTPNKLDNNTCQKP
jgi:sulfite exporter TauE/SafE